MKWSILKIKKLSFPEGRYDVHIKADVGHDEIIDTWNCKDELEAYTDVVAYIKRTWGDDAYENKAKP